MNLFLQRLMENGPFALAAVVACALALVVLTAALAWLGRRGLSTWSGSTAEAADGLSRRLWKAALGAIALTGALGAVGWVLASAVGVRLAAVAQERMGQMAPTDWLALGVPLLQTLGLVVVALVAARVLRSALHPLAARLGRWPSLQRHEEPLAALLGHLGQTLQVILLFVTLLVAWGLLGLPDGGARLLGSLAYLAGAVYLARVAVGLAHLGVDVAIDLSQRAESPNTPLRYLARFQHLGGLTKRTAEYLIYVGLATWVVEQLTPGTWAADAGVILLHIITLFYASRVLVEVCVVGLNEILLARPELSPSERQQRQTLVPLVTGALRYGIYFTAVLMALEDAGYDPTPLLAGAGVAGLAIGLGAQSLVGDVVAGFFILFEGLYLVGDLVEVDDVAGKVEEIGVRVTRIRDDAGVLHAIPNGEVRKVSSHSKGYVNVVVDIPVPYGEDVRAVIAALSRKAVALRAETPDIIGPTEVALEEYRETSVLLRATTMVRPGTTEEMGDVVRLALWEALHEAGIATPYTRHAVITAPEPTRYDPSAEERIESVARTDIQRIKAYNLYLALDVSHNGHIDRGDVQALGERLVTAWGGEADEGARVALARQLDVYWAEIARHIDVDHDGRISQEEFLTFCAAVARDPSGPGAETVEALADATFLASDRNRTGSLSMAEFLGIARAFGLADAAATAGFHLIDRDRTGALSREEWGAFFLDVFRSRKLSDAAAVVFGPGCRASDAT